MQQPWSCLFPTAGRPFVKMQGLRNHFVIVDGRKVPYAPGPAEIVRICDVRTGIGGDQLLVIEPPSDAGRAAGAVARMRILNIDGRESGACGNATRCVAWLLLEEAGQDAIALETMAGILPCTRAGRRTVRVGMGRITDDWRAIPLARAVDTARLPIVSGPLRDGVASAIGNPHVNFFVDGLDRLDVAALAHPVLTDPLFPQQVNVGVAEVLGPGRLRLRVYERPGLLTAACGTGACVAVRAAQMRGLIGPGPALVEMGAGSVQIDMSPDGSAEMTGPVEFCFSGRMTGEEGAAT